MAKPAGPQAPRPGHQPPSLPGPGWTREPTVPALCTARTRAPSFPLGKCHGLTHETWGAMPRVPKEVERNENRSRWQHEHMCSRQAKRGRRPAARRLMEKHTAARTHGARTYPRKRSSPEAQHAAGLSEDAVQGRGTRSFR